MHFRGGGVRRHLGTVAMARLLQASRAEISKCASHIPPNAIMRKAFASTAVGKGNRGCHLLHNSIFLLAHVHQLIFCDAGFLRYGVMPARSYKAMIKCYIFLRRVKVDPITTAILTVLPSLAAETVKSGVKDAYEGLKAVIVRKWGDAAPISKAVTALERDPESKAQAAVLEEKVKATKATEDADVADALRKLLDQMKAQGIGGEAISGIHVQISGGKVGIAVAKDVAITNFNMGELGKK